MFTQTRFKRFDNYGMTTLVLEGPDSVLQLKFLSRLGKRERRTLVHSLFVQIRPWIRHFTQTTITHSGDGLIHDRRAILRGVKLPHSNPLSSLSGSFGFELRMKRLEFGLTQSQLAQLLGIHRSHLSDLERGLYLPNSKTRAEIARVLELAINCQA